MALPCTCSSLGRSLLSRNISRVARPAFVNSRASIAVPFRQFASSSWRFEEAVKPAVATPESVQPEHVVSEEQRSRNARTVFLRYFPRLITPSHVRRLFEAEGLEILSLKMRIDRFFLFNDAFAHIEMADQQQARKAIAAFTDSLALGKKVLLDTNRADYSWDQPLAHYSRYMYLDEHDISKAVAPILEGRRVTLYAQTPFWHDLNRVSDPNRSKQLSVTSYTRDVVIRNLSKFGLEAVGDVPRARRRGAPKKEETSSTTFLCHVDFLTKDGADEACRTFDNTELEGVKVRTTKDPLGQIIPATARQIRSFDKDLLKELQEKGLAPMEIEGQGPYEKKT